MNMNPLLLVDSYKVNHTKMYPEGMNLLYSNFTPRKSRIPGINKVVVFGLQHFFKTYLIDSFNKNFFERPLQDVMNEYKKHIQLDNYSHIEELHKLQYVPLHFKALPEGSHCPIGVPVFTVHNTQPISNQLAGWLVNYLETLNSCSLWQPITSATISNEYFKLLSRYAIETTGSSDGVQWQGHDFSMRGMSSVESAILSGMGHLVSFTGTDTIPAIYQLEKSYNAEGLIGASVPATEHSVMCMGQKESEINTFKRLLNLYPTGILSVVSDTWDLWKVLTEYLPELKSEILSRDGKLVIRPDSGDPVDIICGHKEFMIEDGKYYTLNNRFMKDYPVKENDIPACKGVIELLWDVFGGTINEQGYKVLNSHIGAIYGDSITLNRAKDICERLKQKGFASTNIVLGIGSYTYQYNTRDTFGFAMKATYGEVNGEGREIFKDPVTDDGTKRSAKGLLAVYKNEIGDYYLHDQVSWKEEQNCELKTVFKDGKIFNEQTLSEIRERIKIK